MSEEITIEEVASAKKPETSKKSGKKNAKPKKHFFKGVRAEFKKIIWPDKMSIVKQTTAVVIISVLLGAVIKVLDMIIQLGLSLIV